MVDRISLDQTDVSLGNLFEQARDWENIDAADLTLDQVAILNLKRVIELKDQAGDLGGGKECFVCATGA